MKRFAIGLGLVLLAGLLYAAIGMAWAHGAIRREGGSLPELAAIEALADSGDIPRALFMLNTASQKTSRANVLSRDRDPRPDDPYVMGFPAFALQWDDGRLLLIDAGMTAAGAAAFGRLTELGAGAEPLVFHSSVARQLRTASERVGGLIFTHMHVDHVGGIGELCPAARRALPVYMTEAQSERPNYTTRPALRMLDEAGCVRRERLPGAALAAVSGFAGVYVIHAAGHTPGSQLVLALVRDPGGTRRVAFTGDIANHIDGIRHDIPKPFLYRLLIVPENDHRLSQMRRLLAALMERGWSILVSHDELWLDQQSLVAWPSQRGQLP